MLNRFFKLLYIFSFVGICLSLLVVVILEISHETSIRITYKAKCLSNNEYVVLQGAQYNEAYTFDNFVLNDTIYGDTKRTLNFYCKHYDEIQKHITAYVESKTPAEIRDANADFFQFRERVISGSSSYPPLYTLEEVDKVFLPYMVLNPILDWVLVALCAFVLLQVARMSYVYVVFGQVVWHPFRQQKNNE